MTKEEYIRRMGELSDRFMKLQQEKDDLKLLYIRESEEGKFKCGDKVIVHKDGESIYAFVMGYDLYRDGEIRLVLHRAKKDGTPSKNIREFYHPECGDTVEKIE